MTQRSVPGTRATLASGGHVTSPADTPRGRHADDGMAATLATTPGEEHATASLIAISHGAPPAVTEAQLDAREFSEVVVVRGQPDEPGEEMLTRVRRRLERLASRGTRLVLAVASLRATAQTSRLDFQRRLLERLAMALHPDEDSRLVVVVPETAPPAQRAWLLQVVSRLTTTLPSGAVAATIRFEPAPLEG